MVDDRLGRRQLFDPPCRPAVGGDQGGERLGRRGRRSIEDRSQAAVELRIGLVQHGRQGPRERLGLGQVEILRRDAHRVANNAATVALGAGAGAAPGYGISTSATPPGIYSIGTTPTGIGSIGTGALNTGVPTGLGITEGSALTGTGIGAGNTAGMNMYQKAALGTLALKGLTSGAGTQGTTTATTQSSSPTYTTTTSTPVAFNPGKNTAFPTTTPIYNTPTMGSNQNTGLAYQPMTFKYYAHGGIADLGGYAAGGKLLKGPGDGMSDSIVANIGGKQPARLADGEFVVPADVVSHLGNGSTDAGAKHLYKMMDNIRKARTGNPKQGKKINADKFLPRN